MSGKEEVNTPVENTTTEGSTPTENTPSTENMPSTEGSTSTENTTAEGSTIPPMVDEDGNVSLDNFERYISLATSVRKVILSSAQRRILYSLFFAGWAGNYHTPLEKPEDAGDDFNPLAIDSKDMIKLPQQRVVDIVNLFFNPNYFPLFVQFSNM